MCWARNVSKCLACSALGLLDLAAQLYMPQGFNLILVGKDQASKQHFPRSLHGRARVEREKLPSREQKLNPQSLQPWLSRGKPVTDNLTLVSEDASILTPRLSCQAHAASVW